MLASQKIRVGVLRGGPSSEYSVSLQTGKHILEQLPEEYYTPVDIVIDQKGLWHESGLPKNPENILKKIDVAFNALHGTYGEDGEVVKIFEQFGTPYTGSGVFSSAMGMNKIFSKKIYADNNLKTPFSVSLPFETLSREKIHDVFMAMPGPFVVKPASAGSSLGVKIAHSKPELEESIIAAFEYSPFVLIEEFIKGKEVLGGVVEQFRNSSLYPLMPFPKNPQERLSLEEKRAIEEFSLRAHTSLGLRHYSSSDFMVHPKRGIFILETDSLPQLHASSGFLESLKSSGTKVSDFFHHVVGLAMGKR